MLTMLLQGGQPSADARHLCMACLQLVAAAHATWLQLVAAVTVWLQVLICDNMLMPTPMYAYPLDMLVPAIDH